MTNANFRRTLVGAAVVAALGVVATPTSAAPYRGTFDPTDFEGAYTIDFVNVDSACLETNGWKANEGDCAVSLLDVYADVYSYGGLPSPTFDGRLRFAPPPITSPSDLFGIYVYGGLIQSLDTGLIPYIPAESTSTADSWWIQFVSGHINDPPPCGDYCNNLAAAQIDPSVPAVYLYANNQDESIASARYTSAAVDIAAIPEPGTMSLLLGALGGGWLARRRRRKQEADSS